MHRLNNTELSKLEGLPGEVVRELADRMDLKNVLHLMQTSKTIQSKLGNAFWAVKLERHFPHVHQKLSKEELKTQSYQHFAKAYQKDYENLNEEEKYIMSTIKDGRYIDMTARQLLNLKGNNGKTPVNWMRRHQYTYLLNQYYQQQLKKFRHDAHRDLIDVTHKDQYGLTVLHWAATLKDAETINQLIETDTDVNALDEDNWTPLHHAARYGDASMVKALLDKGADVNALDEDNWTPLHHAARYGDASMVKALLDKGANINARSNNNNTPLHYAANYGDASRIKALLDKGADVNATQNDNWTPLHFAARYGDASRVKALIAAGADVDATQNDNWTPLLIAARYGDVIMVKALIAAGADVDVTNNNNLTPLHIAACYGDASRVKALIAAGADVDVLNNDNWTLLLIAARYGDVDKPQIIEYLRNPYPLYEAKLKDLVLKNDLVAAKRNTARLIKNYSTSSVSAELLFLMLEKDLLDDRLMKKFADSKQRLLDHIATLPEDKQLDILRNIQRNQGAFAKIVRIKKSMIGTFTGMLQGQNNSLKRAINMLNTLDKKQSASSSQELIASCINPIISGSTQPSPDTSESLQPVYQPIRGFGMFNTEKSIVNQVAQQEIVESPADHHAPETFTSIMAQAPDISHLRNSRQASTMQENESRQRIAAGIG